MVTQQDTWLRSHSLEQARELRVLNEVIARRKRRMRSLNERLRVIKEIHGPLDIGGVSVCKECGQEWPCRTLEVKPPQGEP